MTGRMALTLATAVLLATPVAAQETRFGEENFVSPPATLAQLGWLTGQWEGEGIGGAPAMESWLPPMGGTMVGTFVQESAEGAIMFTELLYLMEENGSLILRLKHFNADLTSWEEKDEMLTFRLVAIEDCAAYFNALTLRCADPEKPGEGLVAAVRMEGGGELLFNFLPAEQSISAAGPCHHAPTTTAMNACLADVLGAADAQRERYLAKAVSKHEDRPEILTLIGEAEATFAAYRDAECGARYEDFIGGTIRHAMALTCRIDLTDARTKTIWDNWLTYPDSTPADLPEPNPSM